MNRREWIKTGAGALLAQPALGVRAKDAVSPRVIDTHTHFYDPTRAEGVPWPAKGSKLYRPVLPEDWKKQAAPLGIKETVVVEASAWLEDNQWILDLAAKESCIVGFVGHIDPPDPNFADNLRRFASNPIFRGVRWGGGLFSAAENEPAMLKGAKLLADLGLELDVNGPATALPGIGKLATSVPDLRIVINHLGGSGDPKSLRPEWKENIRAVSRHPNVFMKVSALVEQVKGAEGQAPADTAYYLPILDHLWECFGEDRVIYGSNWPVSDRGASYEVVFNIVKEYFSSIGSEAAEKYFWKNSLAAYRWVDRK
ncbi:MAG: amidohydrolase family protein [Verrucomicrobiaceae bacterium]|nr:amidohydrolase family protein [Verrucomicrobiaceae bacterium]